MPKKGSSNVWGSRSRWSLLSVRETKGAASAAARGAVGEFGITKAKVRKTERGWEVWGYG